MLLTSSSHVHSNGVVRSTVDLSTMRHEKRAEFEDETTLKAEELGVVKKNKVRTPTQEDTIYTMDQNC